MHITEKSVFLLFPIRSQNINFLGFSITQGEIYIITGEEMTQTDMSVACLDKIIFVWLRSRYVQHAFCLILWHWSSVEHVWELLYMLTWFSSNMLDLRLTTTEGPTINVMYKSVEKLSWKYVFKFLNNVLHCQNT